MAMRNILVPTDGSECATLGVRYAVALARQYEARLHGLHVVDIKMLEGPFLRDVSASLGASPYVSYQDNIASILDERGKAVLQAFAEACEASGATYETSTVTGVVPRVIIESGELADLIVMGRGGEHNLWLDGLVGSTTAAVVRGAQRPVLVTGTDTPKLERFLVAYDGSTHARRALQSAVNIAIDWHLAFDVLAVADEKRASVLLAEAKSYVESHHLESNYISMEGDPSEKIVAHATETEASLIVMGAYGHTKVRELVVGSVTAYVLNHAPCPLLLTR
jgi:nucleotide-binding universal stress UspA family protein